MKWTVTKILILSTPVIWVAWDVIAFLNGGNANTESATIWRWAYTYASIPFAWGILTAHLFDEVRAPASDGYCESAFQIVTESIALVLAGLWVVADVAWDGCFLTRVIYMMGHRPIFPMFFGMIVGFIFCQMTGATKFKGDQ